MRNIYFVILIYLFVYNSAGASDLLSLARRTQPPLPEGARLITTEDDYVPDLTTHDIAEPEAIVAQIVCVYERESSSPYNPPPIAFHITDQQQIRLQGRKPIFQRNEFFVFLSPSNTPLAYRFNRIDVDKLKKLRMDTGRDSRIADCLPF